MKIQSKIKFASFAAAAAFGLLAGLPGVASGGGLHIDINLGVPAPVVHSDVVVVDYDHYCVGYHRALYDADWRLRNAQIDQWHAQEALDGARHREGEVTVVVEDQEAFLADYERKVADSDAALLAARAAVGKAADDAADAAARLHAFEKRIAGAKDDRDAARTLHDGAALEDAEHRIHINEEAAAGAAADLHAAEGRMGDLRAAEAAAAAFTDARVRLVDVHASLPRLHDDLAAAHDEVFAAQQRLDVAMGAVALALHDRDEALWMLHRDEILTGRASFASCGFTIDLGVWGGRMPSDPEVVHMYFVHPVAYWVERPVEIQTRVIEVDRVAEISRVRVIQEKHEGPRFHEVVKFETAVPVETRRQYAQRVVVERERLTTERTERATAIAEHRAPRIPDTERAEARAIVGKAKAEAKATNIEAHAQAQAEVTKARADAKSEKIEARAEQDKAHADARSEKVEAKAELDKAHADARSQKIESQAAAKAEENKARADAKSEKIEARASADAEETKARADARAKETEQRAEAKSEKKPVPAAPTRGQAASDPKHDARTPRDSHSAPEPTASSRDSHNSSGSKPNDPRTAKGDTKSKDPRNQNKDGQAAVDPNR